MTYCNRGIITLFMMAMCLAPTVFDLGAMASSKDSEDEKGVGVGIAGTFSTTTTTPTNAPPPHL